MIRLKLKKQIKALSLVEVMVATVISITVGIAVMALFVQGSRLWSFIIGRSEINSGGEAAMNYMTNELKYATVEAGSPARIVISAGHDSITFFLPTDLDGNWGAVDNLGETEWDTGNPIQYIYIPASNSLIRTEGGIQATLAKNVTGVEFKDNTIDGTLLREELMIILTLTKQTQQRVVSATFTSRTKLRN
ncbi:MAG: hypothetical protein DRP74_07685 [Candidatus Omnitrophota bacterium]|nr:MAG: hypothetical protein DRP74_07685 [Candidatus Omnitrophota bacterium]